MLSYTRTSLDLLVTLTPCSVQMNSFQLRVLVRQPVALRHRRPLLPALRQESARLHPAAGVLGHDEEVRR